MLLFLSIKWIVKEIAMNDTYPGGPTYADPDPWPSWPAGPEEPEDEPGFGDGEWPE